MKKTSKSSCREIAKKLLLFRNFTVDFWRFLKALRGISFLMSGVIFWFQVDEFVADVQILASNYVSMGG